jgi:hypothetical protein
MAADENLVVALACFLLVGFLTLALCGLPGDEPTPLRTLGGKLMSALDDALARFTAFAQGVLSQLKSAQSSNDEQTGKLAELQAALDAALSDDNADKSAIAFLQAEVSSLQDEVAAQINAAVDALQNPPAPVVEVPAVVEEPVEPVVVEPVVVEPVVVEPVVEAPAVDETVVVDERPQQ